MFPLPAEMSLVGFKIPRRQGRQQLRSFVLDFVVSMLWKEEDQLQASCIHGMYSQRSDLEGSPSPHSAYSPHSVAVVRKYDHGRFCLSMSMWDSGRRMFGPSFRETRRKAFSFNLPLLTCLLGPNLLPIAA